jgi:hypothetical protein
MALEPNVEPLFHKDSYGCISSHGTESKKHRNVKVDRASFSLEDGAQATVPTSAKNSM